MTHATRFASTSALLLGLLALLALLAHPGLAQAAPGRSAVTRLAAGRVYVGAGISAGLQEGDTLRVVRGPDVIAALIVSFAAADRSACDTLWTHAPLQVGDVVTGAFAPPASAPAAIASPAPEAAAQATPRITRATPPPPATVPPPLAAGAGSPATPRTSARTKISYLAGGSAYVDAGRNDGILLGDTLEVVRNGRPVGALRVSFTASRRASCDTLWTLAALALGDEVRYQAAPVPAAPAAGTNSPDAAAAVAGRTSTVRAARLRGRAGLRWLAVTTQGGRFQQPALDLRVDRAGAADEHVDLSFDIRTRRTTRDFQGLARHTDETARVYHATLTLRSLDAHRGLTAGRQTSPTLASIGLFDGVLLRSGGDRHAYGIFSGTQPEPLRYGLSTEIVQSGAFVEWHQRPGAVRHYGLALGGVTSQQHGMPNRDFLFTQGLWFSPGLSTSLTQELDVNRGWKRRLGESAVTPTSTFGMARAKVTSWSGVSAGYDNRRNVRLYRDRLTPETQFDDAYREGGWLGGDAQFVRHVRVTGELRRTAGADRSHAWNWSTEAYRLGRMNAALRARVSQYDGAIASSRLSSGSFGIDPWPLSHIDASFGVRRTRAAAQGTDDVEHWQSVDVDVTLGRRWYANGGWEHDHGGSSGQTRQLQGGVSLRF